jgi:hypothetical protein
MKKFIYFTIVGLTILSSCKNYLDVVPDNIATVDYAFRNRVVAERYLYTCYSYMPRHGTGDDPALAGDEVWSNPNRNTNFPNHGCDLMYFGNNVTNPLLNYWNGSTYSKPLWAGIRDCNIFLENIDKVRDLENYDKIRWVAEVKFLKAYYHFYLLELYGPIPIVKDNLPVTALPEELAIYREPVDKVIDYIVQLLDEASPDLPLVIESKISEIGRITRSISLSVKAKVLVTAASPLFNGNADYKMMVDNRGTQLFNQTYDPAKWTKALAACKAAIDTCTSAGFSLYRYSNTSLGLADVSKTIITVTQKVTDKWNSETIWGWAGDWINPSNTSGSTSRFIEEFTVAPLDQTHRTFSGCGTWAPTMKAVEMFYSKNGVPIEEDPTYAYGTRYDLATVPASDKYLMQPGYLTAKIHMNREPRFYGSVGVDGGWWFGVGRYNDVAQWPIQSKSGQVCGRQGMERYTPTSFYIKKLYNIESVFSGALYLDKRWDFPVFRLADLYLLYAEALNETLAAPTADVFKYVDMIRDRAGLQSVAASWSAYSIYPQKYTTKDGMRSIIHKERNIELAFEFQNFWDMRRWKEAVQNFSQPIKGWNINGTTAQEFYQVTIIKLIDYNPRDLFWPIKQGELSINKNLVQNPGW